MTIAAAITILILTLTTTALAISQSVDFSRIYRIVFGDNSEYIEQYIEQFVSDSIVISGGNALDEHQSEDVTQPIQAFTVESEFDGIVFTLISAINDGDSLRIFATIQDTKGDRLSGSIDFEKWALSQGHGGNISVIEYDRTTRTAIVLITSIGEHHESSATLSIDRFTIEREFTEGLREDRIDVYDILQNHTAQAMSWEEVSITGGVGRDPAGKPLLRNSSMLTPDEVNIEFDNVGWTHISNIGFVDGFFHVQTAKLYNNDNNYLYNIRFVNENNDEVYADCLRIDFIEYENRYGYDGQNLFYGYHEWIYESITNIEQLKDLRMVIDVIDNGNTIEGNWEFSFDIPKRITTEFTIDVEIVTNGEIIEINSVSLSPLGLFLSISGNIAPYYRHEDIAIVTYEDGTFVELNKTSIQGYQDNSILVFSGSIIEVEKVAGIVIGRGYQ
jgi:hypothetical protein